MGCSIKMPTPLENIRNIEKLKVMFLQLDKRIDSLEAQSLAQESILYAQKLAKKYDLVSPPYAQNTLVNFGFKNRGLCYHWAEDMLSYLVSQNYKTLDLHSIGANIGKLNEHNALSVSFKGADISHNIVLDAWRDSGNLFFIKIEEDSKYKWKERY